MKHELPEGLSHTVDQMTGGMRDNLTRTEIAMMCQAYLVWGIQIGFVQCLQGALCCPPHTKERLDYMEYAFKAIMEEVKPWVQ